MPSVGPAPPRLKWFPPLTMQLRMRAVKQIILSVPSDPSSQDWVYYATIHYDKFNPETICITDKVFKQTGEDFVKWVELDVQGPPGRIRSCYTRIWRVSPEESESSEPELVYSCSMSFSGMTCLGSHRPHLGRNKRTNDQEPLLIVYMCNNYFLAEQAHSRSLFIGPFNQTQILNSYDTNFLIRFLRMNRASVQQEQTNKHLKSELIKRGLDVSVDEEMLSKPKPMSLRQEVFSVRVKEARTRVKEITLKNKIDELKMRIKMRKEEKEKREAYVEDKVKKIEEIKSEIEVRTVKLMDAFHVFGKEKVCLKGWIERYEENTDFCKVLLDRTKKSQLKMVSKFQELFPIQNAKSATPTINWISQPSVEEAKANSRQDIMLSVTLGWVAQLVTSFSSILDVPLRYPIRLWGSNTTIVEFVHNEGKVVPREFPLYTKNVDLSRAEFGLFLLNKDLVQLRWICGLETQNWRRTLTNLEELMSLCSRMPSTSSLEKSNQLSLSPPPNCAKTEESEIEVGEEPVVEAEGEEDLEPKVAENGSAVQNKENKENDLPSTSSSSERKPNQFSWGAVTDRTKALSIPTSFQRRKTKKVVNNT